MRIKIVCESEMSWRWELLDADETPLAVSPTYFPSEAALLASIRRLRYFNGNVPMFCATR